MEQLQRNAKGVHKQKKAEWESRNRDERTDRKATKRKKRNLATQNHKEEDLFQDPLDLKESYGCSICGKTFTKLGHRDLHELQTHSSDGWVQRAECDECDKSFSNKDNLNRHKCIDHCEPEEHKCQDCPAKFTRDGLLDYHRIK